MWSCQTLTFWNKTGTSGWPLLFLQDSNSCFYEVVYPSLSGGWENAFWRCFACIRRRMSRSTPFSPSEFARLSPSQDARIHGRHDTIEYIRRFGNHFNAFTFFRVNPNHHRCWRGHERPSNRRWKVHPVFQPGPRPCTDCSTFSRSFFSP